MPALLRRHSSVFDNKSFFKEVFAINALKNRARRLFHWFAFGLGVLILSLFSLTLVNGPAYLKQADQSRRRTLALPAARGRITDRYGRTVAGTENGYEVLLTLADCPADQLNSVLANALSLLPPSSAPRTHTLPISQTEQGYTYTEEDVSSFLTAAGLAPETTADGAVSSLTARFEADGVPPGLLLDVLALRLAAQALGYRAFRPVVVCTFSDYRLCPPLYENAAALPGIRVQAVPQRVYPFGDTLCHVLGYLGRISAEKAEQYDAQGYDINRDKIGITGIEAQFESVLRGQPGTKTVTVDPLGRQRAVLKTQEPAVGGTVVLSIDIALQQATETALQTTMAAIRRGEKGIAYPNARTGAAVILSAKTGDVLAMASVPAFDPNDFVGPVSQSIWNSYAPVYASADPTLPRPLVNNAIVNVFAPGSVFKPVTALAALEAGVVTAQETIVDLGRYTRFSASDAPACWTWNDTQTTHGAVNLRAALAQSCNYYFYELGYRIGSARLSAMAERLGLGAKTGVSLPGEAAGAVDSRAHADQAALSAAQKTIMASHPSLSQNAVYKVLEALLEHPGRSAALSLLSPLGLSEDECLSAYAVLDGARYRPSRVLISAIGQGGTNATVLQMANMLAAITQNGRRYSPRLVLSLPDSVGEQPLTQLSAPFLSEAHVCAVLSGLSAAVQEGTAKQAFVDCTVPVAAKTGTAENTGRSATAWFIACAPANDPEIVLAIMIAQGGQGSYAASAAREMIDAYFSPGTGTAAMAAGALLP